MTENKPDSHFGGMKPPQPWQPMTDPVELAKIGKLGEEAAELAKACFRAVIQGLDGVDPADGVVNREAIRKELADVVAGMNVCEALVGTIDPPRVQMKVNHLHGWHDLLRSPASSMGVRATGWLPIESAPTDGTIILLRGAAYGIEPDSYFSIGAFSDGWRAVDPDDDDSFLPGELGHVTHWQPLLAPSTAPVDAITVVEALIDKEESDLRAWGTSAGLIVDDARLRGMHQVRDALRAAMVGQKS